ncbi:restriction endonuclease subunit S [Vibrio cyclitrophicus]
MSSLQVIPEGYKKTEVGIIPEDWDVKTFGQVMNIRHGKDQKSVQVTDGLYPIFGTGGQMGTTNTPLYDKSSVLIGRKGTINKPRFMDTPFWTVDTLFYSEVSSKDSAKFIYYKFCMIDWMQYNESSGVPSLNASTIESVFNSFPKLEEQIAIANSLSDVDALLSELEKLIAKKQAIKTATMQQLLTGKTRLPQFSIYADGDKQGQIKGTKPSELGEIPEDWDVYSLGSLFNITAGGDLRKSQFFPIRTDKYSYPIYSNAITNKGLYGYCSTFDYCGEYLTITARGGIGHAVERNGKFCAIGRLLVFSPKQNTSCKYVAELVNQYVGFANESTGVPQLTAPQVAKYKMAMPEFEEQTVIATILSDMDEDIQALQQRLSKTRQIKQGMMQELLTGKTRLPFEKSDDMKLQGEPNAD